MDSSPPGSSVHGILQARILEWIAISFSRGSSPPRDWTRVSCIARQILYRLSYRQVLDANFPWSLIKSGFSKSISCFFSIEKEFFPLLLLSLLQFLTMSNIYLAGAIRDKMLIQKSEVALSACFLLQVNFCLVPSFSIALCTCYLQSFLGCVPHFWPGEKYAWKSVVIPFVTFRFLWQHNASCNLFFFFFLQFFLE